jgi:hypothetical protein
MSKIKLYNEDRKIDLTGLSLEEYFEKLGVMDEREIDYLNHLEVPEIEEVALEGIIKAKAMEIPDIYHGAYNEIKGWVIGVESKRKYTVSILEDLIDWLKDRAVDNRNLDLDMGAFKTWMKTSKYYRWRYYYLLNDSMWNEIESDLKKGNITELESLYSVDLKSRKDIARVLESITDINGLIKIVETYKTRTDKFYDLILKRKVKIKSAPFQVILLGAVDLRHTLKKIVNLAV